MREVQLAAIVQEDSPILVLKDKASSAAIPIWIAMPEFVSIFLAWQGWPFPRPLSHDLVRSVLEAGEMWVERVEVAEISKKVFSTRGFLWEKTGKSPKLWMRGLPMPLLWPCGWGPDFCGGRSVRPGGGSSGTRANCLRAPNPSKIKTIFGASGKGVPGPQEG